MLIKMRSMHVLLFIFLFLTLSIASATEFSSSDEVDLNESRKQIRALRKAERNATIPADVRPSITRSSQSNQQRLNRKWEHALPFYAQKAIELGFDLPLPFSFSIVPTYMQQGIGFSGLKLAIPSRPDIDFDRLNLDEIDFGHPESNTQTWQLKLSSWVLPFMQVGVHAGRFDGSSDLEVTIPDSVFNHIKPGIKPIHFSPDFSGWNYGVSTNFTAGFGQYFGVLPISYTKSETDDKRTESVALLISPRIGRSFHLNNLGLVSPFVGFSYMKVKGFTQQNEPFGYNVAYSISSENENEWAGVVGLNWNLARHYGVVTEFSVGPERTSMVMMLDYRW